MPLNCCRHISMSQNRILGLTDVAVFLMTFMESKTYRSTYESRIHNLKKDLAEKEHQLVEQQQTIKKLQDDLGTRKFYITTSTRNYRKYSTRKSVSMP